jgi:hypothetical protein
VPYENTVHGVGAALEMICDSKLNNDLVIQHPNYRKQDRVSTEGVELFNVELQLTILDAASNKQV